MNQPATSPNRTPLWTAPTAALLSSCALAGFGAWIDFLAILTLAAYVYQAGPATMALVSALTLVPALLLAPRVGRWLDRGDARRIVLVALALRTAATGTLMLQPDVAVFCVLVALRSAVTVPVEPGFNVLVAQAVARDHVARYFGVLGLLRNGSKIAAPVIGTAIASLHGEHAALGLSIVLSAAAMVVLAAAAVRPRAAAASPTPAAPHPAGADAAGPADATRSGAMLLQQLLVTVTIFAFMVFLLSQQLPVLLRDAGFDKALLGALVSCSGAGGILAAVYMTRRNAAVTARDPMLATTVSVLATAALFVLLGLAFLLPRSVAPFVAGAVFFGTGIFGTVEAIRSNTVVVQCFAARTGEVTGKIQSFSSAAMLAAPWVAAALMPWLALPWLLIGAGSVGLVLLGLVAMHFRASAP